MEGVTSFIKKDNNDTLRLVFNDVVATANNETPNWKHGVLFTSNSYNADTLTDLKLSTEQFAEIGEN